MGRRYPFPEDESHVTNGETKAHRIMSSVQVSQWLTESGSEPTDLALPPDQPHIGRTPSKEVKG